MKRKKLRKEMLDDFYVFCYTKSKHLKTKKYAKKRIKMIHGGYNGSQKEFDTVVKPYWKKYGIATVDDADTCQITALGLRNAQPVERILDIVRHAVPIGLLIGIGLHVRDDMIHIKPRDRGAPIGHLHAVVYLERFQT